jgi:hypothetical protein
VQRVPRAYPTLLEAEFHVRGQPHGLPSAARIGEVSSVRKRPLGNHSTVIEHRLTDEFDVDVSVEACDGADKHVVGVVVCGGSGVRRDRVLALARADRQRVTNDRQPVTAFHVVVSVLVPGS